MSHVSAEYNGGCLTPEQIDLLHQALEAGPAAAAEMDAAPEPGADADLGTLAVDQAPDAETGWAAPDPAWPGADLELDEPTEFDRWPEPEFGPEPEPEAEL